jgi:hypothetical protein
MATPSQSQNVALDHPRDGGHAVIPDPTGETVDALEILYAGMRRITDNPKVWFEEEQRQAAALPWPPAQANRNDIPVSGSRHDRLTGRGGESGFFRISPSIW